MTETKTQRYSVDPSHSIPLYAQLVGQISHKILGGDLSPGETLPSVRQMADTLEINSLTVQKTYKILEMNGLVEIRKGVGAFVSEKVPAMSSREKDKLLQKELTPALRLA